MIACNEAQSHHRSKYNLCPNCTPAAAAAAAPPPAARRPVGRQLGSGLAGRQQGHTHMRRLERKRNRRNHMMPRGYAYWLLVGLRWQLHAKFTKEIVMLQETDIQA